MKLYVGPNKTGNGDAKWMSQDDNDSLTAAPVVRLWDVNIVNAPARMQDFDCGLAAKGKVNAEAKVKAKDLVLLKFYQTGFIRPDRSNRTIYKAFQYLEFREDGTVWGII